ncbi:MAG TPA: hypothetical protein VJY15_23070 [Candidatus Acidoferrum sp.]|nr:hypothetical protein [Candidatus Acidoferrum sp.]
MERTGIQLEKTWPQQPVSKEAISLGTVNIRLVVFDAKRTEQDEPGELDGSDSSDGVRGPLDSYLERPGGKGYVVFLVHGQRQDILDESFVGIDLGFKYLRKRTMIVVEVDGLVPEAIGQLVQGSRQGFYRGDVYYAMHDRIVAVLDKDPDLKRLEAEAEQEIAELKAGDESVRTKLDALIEGHHAASPRTLEGNESTSSRSGTSGHGVANLTTHEIVLRTLPGVGENADLPVLVAEPPGALMRLYPGEAKKLNIRSDPSDAWKHLQSLDAFVTPHIGELEIEIRNGRGGAELNLLFREPEAFPEEDYPITGTLTSVAMFGDKKEARVIEREISIGKRRFHPPKPEPILREVPTFIRVVSRQPVKLFEGTTLTHVRMRWDGNDELTLGNPGVWSFHGRCTSLINFPSPVFSTPRKGNFEMLVEMPHGLLPGQILDFQVEAVGPAGYSLSTYFQAMVVEPLPKAEPRKVIGNIREAAQDRRPPYDLRYIDRNQWNSGTCWGSADWDGADAGCFTEPTNSMPLTLIINQDADLLKAMRDEMIGRKLEDTTVKERQSRYTAHVAFHLYQMYLHVQRLKTGVANDSSLRMPNEAELRAEINRVGGTLLKLMER